MSVWQWVTNAVSNAMEEEGFVVHGVMGLVTELSTGTVIIIARAVLGAMGLEGEFVARVMVTVV